MAYSASYLVDLTGIKFDDTAGSTETWIQAMPLGTYEHPQYGTIEITPDRVQRYVLNIKNNVRQQQLDIDYDHKEYSGEAAGWIKDAADRGADGLWVLVDWTQKAYTQLKDKAYRYFSAEYNDEWTDTKTGATYKDVIFGGAITNRPFLKDIMPINLSEVFANVPQPPTKFNEGGSKMKPEQVKAFGVKLGLGEDATEDQVLAGLEAFNFAGPPAGPPAPPAVVDPAEAAKAAAALAALEEAKKLGESNPAMKVVMDLYTSQAELVENQGKQLAEFSEKLRKEKVEKTVKALSDKAKAKGYAIPPTMVKNLTDTLMTINDDNTAKVILDGFDRIVESQIVALGERGYLHGGKTANEDGQTATEEFQSEARKLTSDDKSMTFADAADVIAKRNPELYHRYQEESYAFGGDR